MQFYSQFSMYVSGIMYCQHVSEKDKRVMSLAFHIQNVTVLFRRRSTEGLCIHKRKPGTDHAPWIHYLIVAVHHYVHYRWSLSLVKQLVYLKRDHAGLQRLSKERSPLHLGGKGPSASSTTFEGLLVVFR